MKDLPQEQIPTKLSSKQSTQKSFIKLKVIYEYHRLKMRLFKAHNNKPQNYHQA